MFYLINKPLNESSFKTINNFSKKNNIKKIGHTGTLDPLATGLLLVATDSDTKLIQYISEEDKTYVAGIKFGSSTETYDTEGAVTNFSSNKVEEKDLEKIVNWFLTQEDQFPPIYSAKKINGKKAYEIARKGKEIELKKQKIKVKKAKLINFDFENQILFIELTVSKGTYIRSLAHDLGIFLKTFAHLNFLDRTAIGRLNKRFLKDNNFVKIDITPFINLEIFEPNYNDFKLLKNGVTLRVHNLKDGKYALRNFDEIWGVINVVNNNFNIEKIFGEKITKLEVLWKKKI
ncbi:tRNA pseudouridine synthase B [Mycoplasmopsis maculosa]|uniref:tRNA pseudouridine synthase B n=1 Tax=Mycoplasmopsis maculosa TaxID=114885 RepID=A0A449B5B4_9BACT|nr:tRNA pseudouridine(55) synthase TruB [Mycoplasmopsis maculosa]VEU75790.1 tRNA pseudouridine synthase B [Mycoplasmopsis maculosa]